MAFRNAYLLPIFFGVWFPTSCIVAYVVAVSRKDVTAFFPYISDTGNWAPESCIFGIMLTLAALDILLIGYVRYRQVRDVCEKNNCKPNILKHNTIALFLSCISTFGMIVVANFQITNVLVVHCIGAFLCFGGAFACQIFQVLISYRIYPLIGQTSVNALRVFFTAGSGMSMCIGGITGGISIFMFKGDDLTKWSKKDGGFEFHLISTICEWIGSAFVTMFVVTYTKEFRLIEFREPIIQQRQ